MIRVWVCQVRHEAFVGGESQRCRHADGCERCKGTGVLGTFPSVDLATGVQVGTHENRCPDCKGTGQVSGCGEMELIGGEPVEWCVVHGARRASVNEYNDDLCEVERIARNYAGGFSPSACQFESQIRVGP